MDNQKDTGCVEGVRVRSLAPSGANGATSLKQEHTPLPWVYDPERHTHDSCIYRKGAEEDPKTKEYGYINEWGGVVGSSEWIWLTEEDAKFIVRACNSYYDMLEALEKLAKKVKCTCSDGVEDPDCPCLVVTASIAKAKKEIE